MIRDNKIKMMLKKIEKMSQRYHKMSLLFYELHQSLSIQANKGKKYNELKGIVQNLNFDKLKDESLAFLPVKDCIVPDSEGQK